MSPEAADEAMGRVVAVAPEEPHANAEMERMAKRTRAERFFSKLSLTTERRINFRLLKKYTQPLVWPGD